jgi:hypothetical protein
MTEIASFLRSFEGNNHGDEENRFQPLSNFSKLEENGFELNFVQPQQSAFSAAICQAQWNIFLRSLPSEIKIDTNFGNLLDKSPHFKLYEMNSEFELVVSVKSMYIFVSF